MFIPADKQVFYVYQFQILRCQKTNSKDSPEITFGHFRRECDDDVVLSIWCQTGYLRGVAAAHFSSVVAPKVRKGVKGVGVWWPLRTAPGRPPTLAFFGAAPTEAGKGGKGGAGVAQAREPPSFTPFAAFSVGGLQNCFCFWMLKQVFPQQVILLCASLCQSVITKAEVTVGVQAGCDSQSIRRQLALVAVLAADGELCIKTRGHIKAAVSERMKRPICTGILRGYAFGHRENCRFQLDDVADAEEFVHEGKPL